MGSSQRKIAIVGTGFSGLCLAIQLKKRGIDSFTLFEKADRVGGTWRENTYPGAECDIPSALYSFSFERNPRWTHKWSEQPEILQYLEYCAKKYDIYPHIRFHEEVKEAVFDETSGKWRVTTSGGTTEEFDAFVSAVGQLHKSVIPKFEGADRFAGPSFHSARWNHSVDLKDKNVAVIGNAASAIQFIPQIAPLVKRLTILQRTANWIVPKNDREYRNWEKKLGTLLPALTNLYRLRIWLQGELVLYPLMSRNATSRLRKKSEQAAREYLESKISDPILREKLTPKYPMGAKRILFSDDYYDALARDNVFVVTEPIDHIEERGVATKDGVLHEADVLIYATGFETTSFLTPMRVVGLGGQVINDVWERNGAEAYLGITHTGFPNFFMMYGPNTNLGHNSIVYMIESQTQYILSCLDLLGSNGTKWLDVKPEVQKAYNERIQARMADKVWLMVDKSWYRTKDKVTNNWVGRTTEYRRATRKANAEDYRFG